MDITDRQKKLLDAIIREFIDTAEAVGSISLIDKYNFKLSSATIRNEMAELVIRGYLYKKHSSAGRIPTTKGWRFYVDEVKDDIKYSEGNFIPVNNESVIATLSKFKKESAELIRQSLNFLSSMSGNPSVALLENNIFYSGLSTLPNIPELKESDNLKNILRVLEDYYTLSDIFKSNTTDDDVNILIGEEETKKEEFKNYSVIFAEIRFGFDSKEEKKGFIAVVGPNRMDYTKVIASVKYVSDVIRNMVN